MTEGSEWCAVGAHSRGSSPGRRGQRTFPRGPSKLRREECVGVKEEQTC